MAESATLTIRISEQIKKELEKAADAATQSVTDYVLRSIQLRMAGACKACGRDAGAVVMQPPAMTEAFDEWCAQHVDAEPCLFATIEPQFGPRFYCGTFQRRDVKRSHVPMTLGGVMGGREMPAVIPRHFVVMWAEGRTEINNLRDRLARQGYFDLENSLWQGGTAAPRRRG